MRQNVFRLLFAIALMIAGVGVSFAQVVVTGQVLDAENNAPIVGASVTTGQGTTRRGETSDLNEKSLI